MKAWLLARPKSNYAALISGLLLGLALRDAPWTWRVGGTLAIGLAWTAFYVAQAVAERRKAMSQGKTE